MDVAVTQITSVSTAVTANGMNGLITTFAQTAATGVTVTFTVNNTAVDADSIILASVVDYTGAWTTNGIPVVATDNLVAGTSFDIKISNVHASTRIERGLENRIPASVKKGTGRKPQCHPNRKHYAKGLCASCYHTQAKKKQHKQPVRVIHTHEIIRQVQQPEVSMATKQEEADEQNFFAGKLKEQERKHTMAHENDKPKAEPLKRAEGASKESVVSPAGTTEPTIEFGGDGITPRAEWEENQKEWRKKQAEYDEKRRQRAVEDSGLIQTTEKYKHAAIVAAEERRHAAAEKHEQAEAAARKNG